MLGLSFFPLGSRWCTPGYWCQAGRAGGSSAAFSFILLSLVGSRENLVVTGCRTSLSLPSLHPCKQRGLSERVGWLVSSFLSFLNAQQNLPCLLQALPAAPPATRGPSTLPRNKCSLPTNTNQVSLFCFQPITDSSLPWGGRREGRAHPIPALRKGPSPRSPASVLAKGVKAGLYTANSKKKLPPLPISIANSVSSPLPVQANPLLPSLFLPHTS